MVSTKQFSGSNWYIRYRENIASNSLEINHSIFQKRQPRIKEGDRIVFYKNGAFIAHGVVLKGPPLNEEAIEGQIEFEYIFGQLQFIEAPNDLLGYAYSLPKVYKHFIRPYYHFRRSYGWLTNYEFDVITEHNYFVSRTAFGRIINSLHPSHRSSFINYVTEVEPAAILNEQKDYLRVFNLLRQYINSHIIAHADYLRASDNILENELKIQTQVGFKDFAGSNEEYIIRRQVERIQRARNSVRSETSLDSIADSISAFTQDELEMNKQFKDKCLPINF